MKRRGRPVSGAIFGLLFGFFLTLDLSFFQIASPNRTIAFGLPAAFMLLGIVLGITAPFGRRKPGAAAAAPAAPVEHRSWDQGPYEEGS